MAGSLCSACLEMRTPKVFLGGMQGDEALCIAATAIPIWITSMQMKYKSLNMLSMLPDGTPIASFPFENDVREM